MVVLLSSNPVIQSQGKTKYENFHQNVSQDIVDYYTLQNGSSGDLWTDYRAITEMLRNFLKTCIARGLTLRAKGAGWSFTRVMTTNGYMLDTFGVNRIFQLKTEDISTEYKDPGHLAFVECGATIRQINAALREKGLSLKTSGSSDGQTIAGAMSTGTHGASYGIGGIADCMVGLHIIVGTAKHVWIEKKSRPVVSKSFLDAMGAEFIADDGVFNAAVVSFGSFGFIRSVMIETEDLYTVKLYRKKFGFSDLRNLMTTMDFSKTNLFTDDKGNYPFHFQAVFNPYRMDQAIVTYAYKVKYVVPLTTSKLLQDLGELLYKIIVLLGSADAHLIPGIVTEVLKAGYKDGDATGTLGEIFTQDNGPNNNYSTAMGFHLEDIPRVMEILKTNDTEHPRFAGLYSFRYVKSTGAILGFTNRGDITCVLELDGVHSSMNEKFYFEIWKKLKDAGISFTFHWGKMSDINRTVLESMYGDKLLEWEQTRRNLLEPETLKLFTNEQMNQWGIID